MWVKIQGQRGEGARPAQTANDGHSGPKVRAAASGTISRPGSDSTFPHMPPAFFPLPDSSPFLQPPGQPSTVVTEPLWVLALHWALQTRPGPSQIQLLPWELTSQVTVQRQAGDEGLGYFQITQGPLKRKAQGDERGWGGGWSGKGLCEEGTCGLSAEERQEAAWGSGRAFPAEGTASAKASELDQVWFLQRPTGLTLAKTDEQDRSFRTPLIPEALLPPTMIIIILVLKVKIPNLNKAPGGGH